MTMTVKKLISELKKFPPQARVGWQDHDHGENELNGQVGQVLEASETIRKERNIHVIIRPS